MNKKQNWINGIVLLLLLTVSHAGWASNTLVSTLADLQTALSGTADTVIVSREISLPNGTMLDGNNKVVQVPVPYLTEAGVINTSASNFRVFLVNTNCRVTLRNMTIMGGKKSTNDNDKDAGGIKNLGLLTLENCNILHSNRGLSNVNGKVVLKNCNLIRNQANYGSGVLNNGANAVIVMDGCSFSENCVPSGGGAGGAAENEQGKMFMNNTVMANNYGLIGAINNKPGTSALYFMNCTITGNVGNNEAGEAYPFVLRTTGAGVWAVNSIITDNKYIPKNNSSATEKEIGKHKNESSANSYFINCVMGAVNEDAKATYTNCISENTVGQNVFVDYLNNGLYTGSSTTKAFIHTALVHNANSSFSSPVMTNSAGGKAATGGVTTYFDYDFSGNDLVVKMSYDAGGTNTALGNLTGSTQQVTTNIDGSTRVAGVIGASPTSGAEYYTLKLGSMPSNGDVVGASLYGDTYVHGTELTVTAIPNTGYQFVKWTMQRSDTAAPDVTENPYTFNLNERTVLTPVFQKIQRVAGSGSVTLADWTYGETANTPVPTSETNGTEHIIYNLKSADNFSSVRFSPCL